MRKALNLAYFSAEILEIEEKTLLATSVDTLNIQVLSPNNGSVLRTLSFNKDASHLSIGRELDNDIVIGNGVTSRYHATLERIDGAWHLQNLGKNGCYVNGQRIERFPIIGNTLVRLGKTGSYLRIAIERQDAKESMWSAWHPNSEPMSKKRGVYIGKAAQDFMAERGLTAANERTFTVDPSQSQSEMGRK